MLQTLTLIPTVSKITDLQFEYLYLIHTREVQYKDIIHQTKKLIKNASHIINEIDDCETELKACIHPQTHKLLFNEECPHNDYFESHPDLIQDKNLPV